MANKKNRENIRRARIGYEELEDLARKVYTDEIERIACHKRKLHSDCKHPAMRNVIAPYLNYEICDDCGFSTE